ncbi:MAG: DUF2304 domain-containing protein [Planctomycetota bacterium]
MDLKVRILIFLIAVASLAVIVRLVKSRRIWERYAIVWVYVGLAIALLPFVVDVLDWILYRIGVEYPPGFLLLLGIFAILLLLLQFTVEITTLVRRSRNTVQELAILEERVRRLEAARADAEGEPRT